MLQIYSSPCYIAFLVRDFYNYPIFSRSRKKQKSILKNSALRNDDMDIEVRFVSYFVGISLYKVYFFHFIDSFIH